MFMYFSHLFVSNRKFCKCLSPIPKMYPKIEIQAKLYVKSFLKNKNASGEAAKLKTKLRKTVFGTKSQQAVNDLTTVSLESAKAA